MHLLAQVLSAWRFADNESAQNRIATSYIKVRPLLLSAAKSNGVSVASVRSAKLRAPDPYV